MVKEQQHSMIINTLLKSANPVIVYQTKKFILQEDVESLEMKKLQNKIAESAMAQSMIRPYDQDVSRIAGPYKKWQGPDGGWNCDKRTEAHISSVIETCIPMRALNLAGRTYNNKKSIAAANKAAEYFLSRKLFKRRRDGQMILKRFDKIQYPIQFYDVLYILMVMTEMGKIKDPRCYLALDMLERKRLSNGGFPLEQRNAKTSTAFITNGTFADWGPAGKARMNEFVTVFALWVLKRAGRI